MELIQLTKEQKAKNLEISEYFRNIERCEERDPGLRMFDQSVGHIFDDDEDCGACVGVWLHKFFTRRSSHFKQHHYKFGKFCYVQAMMPEPCTTSVENYVARVCVLLSNAGAPENPFGVEPWIVPPSEVFKRLSE